MSNHAMPFLLLNGGIEVMFIMIQRLEKQNMDDRKYAVVESIASCLFRDKFMDEMFRPQKLYTWRVAREVFERLATSSVMGMTRFSLSKLIDIMTTGLKYIFFTVRHPSELIEVTLNYMESICTWLGRERYTTGQVAIKRFREFAATLTVGQLADVRMELLELLNDKRIISGHLVANGMQLRDGTLNIPVSTYLPPLVTCEAPGTMRYYDGGKLIVSDTFPHPGSNLSYPPHIPVGSWDPVNSDKRMNHTSPEAYLVYNTNREGREIPSSVAVTGSVHPTASSSLGSAAPPTKTSGEMGALNRLAQLVGGNRAVSEKFQVSLFDDDNDDNDVEDNVDTEAAGASASKAVIPPAATPAAPPAQSVKANKELMGIVGEMNTETTKGKSSSSKPKTNTEEDDLLDLLGN